MTLLWIQSIILTLPQKNSRKNFNKFHRLICMNTTAMWVKKCRGTLFWHHQALKRTFLAYIRSLPMVFMQGVFLAMLFRIQRRTPQPKQGLGFQKLGIPLLIAYHSVALRIALIGAHDTTYPFETRSFVLTLKSMSPSRKGDNAYSPKMAMTNSNSSSLPQYHHLSNQKSKMCHYTSSAGRVYMPLFYYLVPPIIWTSAIITTYSGKAVLRVMPLKKQ